MQTRSKINCQICVKTGFGKEIRLGYLIVVDTFIGNYNKICD